MATTSYLIAEEFVIHVWIIVDNLFCVTRANCDQSGRTVNTRRRHCQYLLPLDNKVYGLEC